MITLACSGSVTSGSSGFTTPFSTWPATAKGRLACLRSCSTEQGVVEAGNGGGGGGGRIIGAAGGEEEKGGGEQEWASEGHGVESG